ncbi:unnamed protein product, partial [Gulo gulo]
MTFVSHFDSGELICWIDSEHFAVVLQSHSEPFETFEVSFQSHSEPFALAL